MDPPSHTQFFRASSRSICLLIRNRVHHSSDCQPCRMSGHHIHAHDRAPVELKPPRPHCFRLLQDRSPQCGGIVRLAPVPSSIRMKISRCSFRTPGNSAQSSLELGLRWDAQQFSCPPIPPASTAYARSCRSEFSFTGREPLTRTRIPAAASASHGTSFAKRQDRVCAPVGVCSMRGRTCSPRRQLTTTGVHSRPLTPAPLLGPRQPTVLTPLQIQNPPAQITDPGGHLA